MAAAAKLARLVQRCLADVARHPVEHVDVYVGDDILTWHLALSFPDSSPFTGGEGLSLKAANFKLYVTLQFGEDFPTRPPKLKFLSPWTNHQHLWGDRVCHSLLTDDFLGYFHEQNTHGTSMWSASCALADGEGLGGMPRYLHILREYLSSDLDYEEEKHVKYDATSLHRDVEAQRRFHPDFLETACLMESNTSSTDATIDVKTKDPKDDGGYSRGVDPIVANVNEATNTSETELQPKEWGIDFFLKSALIPGSPEDHPCFDVSLAAGRVPSLSTTMTTLCRRSFEMGARTTDFGSAIAAVLPFPCDSESWKAVGLSLVTQSLQELAPVLQFYKIQLPGFDSEESGKLEAILGMVGEIWKATCICIVKEEGYESERAMSCFVTLHHLLLHLAEEYPGLRAHAVATARSFLDQIEEQPKLNLKTCVPDLGRFLVRFLLTEKEVPLKSNAPTIVRELFSRNVRWVHPDDWADADAEAEEKEEQIEANFEKSQFGMKLTVFQAYYILRSMELGLDSLEAHEALGGRAPPETLRVFQQDCKGIKDLDNFQEFFLWLQLEELAFADIHDLLVKSVVESNARGYNEGLPWAAPS